MDEEIRDRIQRLSPQARALFWELEQWGEECDYRIPPDELIPDLGQRMLDLPDGRAFVELHSLIGHKAREEGMRLEAEAIEADGFAKLIERAQELDGRAGRPVNKHMTLGEATEKLEAAGELSVLEREYVEAVKDELVWVPAKVDEDD